MPASSRFLHAHSALAWHKPIHQPLILGTNTLLTHAEANKQSKQLSLVAQIAHFPHFWSPRSNIPKVGQFAHQISHHETANRAFSVSTSALDARCMSLCRSATETLKEQKVRLVPLEESPFPPSWRNIAHEPISPSPSPLSPCMAQTNTLDRSF